MVGLGLYNMKQINQVILAKLCWRLANEQEPPGVRRLATKFLSPRRIAEEGRKLSCSSIWTSCKKGRPIYVKGLKREGHFSIRNHVLFVGRVTLLNQVYMGSCIQNSYSPMAFDVFLSL